jgi:hypothetical protein
MRIKDIVNELDFMGSPCTKDCSGHAAGYDWSMNKGGRPAASRSPSFNNGAGIAINVLNAKRKRKKPSSTDLSFD